ncbi:MAG: circularly permuted type 2 ATP-grasp protein [Verrucomicrobiota bacterium]
MMNVSTDTKTILKYLPSIDSSSYDEFLDDKGLPRPHWQFTASFLDRLGPDEIESRSQQAARMLHDAGVAYNVTKKNSTDTRRDWQLDPIPFCISSTEWSFLEQAITQRAKLLNLILGDLYGPQELIKSKFLPAPLIFANPGYLRPCHGIPVFGEQRLTFYAVDLARSPDGLWWVLSDRSQAPAGAGYTLENRIVMTHVFPEIFRQGKIQRLSSFFRNFKDSLASLSPTGGNQANTVILTPGPYNETFFEHAYLSRYLGYPLVEGSDLVVRNRKVFLKTLSGLQQVDVILRRVDDDFCDPIELRDDSLLGVPGLINAVRAGSITLANSLGSGLIQSPAFSPFLPALSQQLLGEDLLLPSVANWWCGQDDALKYVNEHLDKLTLRSAFDHPATQANFAPKMPDNLGEWLTLHPEQIVGQEKVILSQAPILKNQQLTSACTTLRLFAMYHNGTFSVMPGGMSRIIDSTNDSSYHQPLQMSGGSKDIFIETQDIEDEHSSSLLLTSQSPRRADDNLPSRKAENIFWLGRYAERFESTSRLLRTLLECLAEERDWQKNTELLPALLTLHDFDQLKDEPELILKATHYFKSLLPIIYDQSHSGSLHYFILRLFNIITLVRDRLSTDNWRTLNLLNDQFENKPININSSINESLNFLNQSILHLSAFNGIITENITRGPSWSFLQIGRYIERITYTSRLLFNTVQDSQAEIMEQGPYETALKIQDSHTTYHRRYLTHSPKLIFDLLITDENNPRSIHNQLNAIIEHIKTLPTSDNTEQPRANERIARRAVSQIHLIDWTSNEPLDHIQLKALLQHTEKAMSELSDNCSAQYFTHHKIAPLSRQPEQVPHNNVQFSQSQSQSN